MTKTFTLVVDETQLNIISKALLTLPHGEVAGLITELQNQINYQLKDQPQTGKPSEDESLPVE